MPVFFSLLSPDIFNSPWGLPSDELSINSISGSSVHFSMLFVRCQLHGPTSLAWHTGFPRHRATSGGGGANVLGPLNSAAKGLSARVSTLPVFIRK